MISPGSRTGVVTMHLDHKPGEVMQVDWAGDTAAVIDTDTGEIIPAYVFVATLPYSGYALKDQFADPQFHETSREAAFGSRLLPSTGAFCYEKA